MPRSFKCILGPAFTALAFATVAAAQTPHRPRRSTTSPRRQRPAPIRTPVRVATLAQALSSWSSMLSSPTRTRGPFMASTASDFTLTEENVPQLVKHFEEHPALTPPTPPSSPPYQSFLRAASPTTRPSLSTEPSISPAARRTEHSLKDQAYVRQKLSRLSHATPPGTRIAIFGLTTQLTHSARLHQRPRGCSRQSHSRSSEKFASAPGFGWRRRYPRTA